MQHCQIWPHLMAPLNLTRTFLILLRLKVFLDLLHQAKLLDQMDLTMFHILKELSKELAQPLCNFFNFSLDKGVLPSSYKEANACPMHKKDEKSLVNNYRPISILNAEVKVVKRLIFKHLFNHLQENSFLTSLQSGLIPGDYCESTYLLVQYTLSDS